MTIRKNTHAEWIGTAALMTALLSAPLPAEAMTYSVIYRFQGGTTDGANPYSTLNNLGGTFYGTTVNGGSCAAYSAGCGSWFSVTAAGSETPLYFFNGGSDGAHPYSDPSNELNALYGTTENGGGTGCGGGGCGTIYKITTGGSETPLYAFKGGSDGAIPFRSPLAVGTNLYGTTNEGGSACGGIGCGTVYSVNSITGHENWVYSFKGGSSDGSESYSRLTKVGALLYGTTVIGGGTGCGGQGCGTVFSISTSGVEHVVYSFPGGTGGFQPWVGVISVAGTLYGTTASGDGGFGTVFSLSTSGTLNWSYSFKGGSDGLDPGFGALLDKGGTLYGTTGFGGGTGCGGSGCGTVFSISTAGTNEKVVRAFKGGSDGTEPNGALSNTNGTLYGTTTYGGGSGCSGSGCGTVFKLKP